MSDELEKKRQMYDYGIRGPTQGVYCDFIDIKQFEKGNTTW